MNFHVASGEEYKKATLKTQPPPLEPTSVSRSKSVLRLKMESLIVLKIKLETKIGKFRD